MPFTPHTSKDIESMLSIINVDSIENLFDEIPTDLHCKSLDNIPEAASEMELMREMQELAGRDSYCLNFLGAGAYEHHIPAAVWDLTSRGEFMTAYTPYQAEASQGTLQLIYEYQTMMASLTGMDVSNASLYDGASALAEAVLMAVRANRKSKSKKILMPTSVHPNYRKTVTTLVSGQDIEVIELLYCTECGHTVVEALDKFNDDDIAAIVVPMPNFFGVIEEVDALTDWAHAHGALVIAQVNPIALALLKEPGAWGENGADIVCGEGQPLGVPLASGGPYFGFMTCKQAYVRQMPGRIVGRTVDLDGKPGFTLTLQAREQHIRRSKATSNICTNQGLAVTAATIHMSLLGFAGLQRVASHCHDNVEKLKTKLSKIKGVEFVFNRLEFHEVVIRIDGDIQKLQENFALHGMQAGYALQYDYPELENTLLVCTTETKLEKDLDTFVARLEECLC